MNASPSRRRFIQQTGLTAAGITLAKAKAPAVIRGADPTAEPVRVAQIGIGTRGENLLRVAASKKSARVVAICDVYKPHLERGVKACGDSEVKTFTDYRRLLDDPRIEAVIIATPDHWHERMLIDAVKAGKDVYCEKGWTTSTDSAKRMREAVKDAGAIMQLGHQGRQLTAADEGRKRIEEGAIGDVTLVQVGRYFNGPPERPPWRWYGSYSNYERPDPAQVIRDLDWEKWLGDAPSIDFNERHFWHWRNYWAYGTGQAGDLLSHEMDHVQSVLRLGIPDSCVTQARNTFWKDDREVPDTWMSSYVFDEADCLVTYHGSMNSRRSQTPEYIGRDGRVIYNSIGQNASMFEVYPDQAAHQIARRPQPEPTEFFRPGKEHRRPDHMEDFFQCVRTRQPTRCNEDEAFVETAVICMAMEAYRTKREVRWDRQREIIIS
jgi:predicted dehydrogenase